jgi:hypothetical protein
LALTGFDVFYGSFSRADQITNDQFPANIMTEKFFRFLGGLVCAVALIGRIEGKHYTRLKA